MKFGVAWVSLFIFLEEKLENSIFFSQNYVLYALAYYSTQNNGTIMIDTSFDSALSPEENEGSMNKIEWEMKAGDSIKDSTQ